MKKLKTTFKELLVSLALAASFGAVFFAPIATAASPGTCWVVSSGEVTERRCLEVTGVSDSAGRPLLFDLNKCYQVNVSSRGAIGYTRDCNTPPNPAIDPPSTTAPGGNADTGSDDLNKLLRTLINVLSAVAMMVFIISFIFAGYQYLTARDNASQVAAAKERIVTLVITFVLYVFGFGLLQWLVPGGIFN